MIILNRSDKERIIIKLYREGRNWDYIAEASHSSMSTIKKVIDKYEQPRAPKVKSDGSRALQMYSKNLNPLEVAIKLNISAEEAEKYQQEFWRLRGMTVLAETYKQNRNSLPFIVSKIYELGITDFSLEQL